MPVRPVRLRERAATDIEQAVSYYLAEADTEVALRFVDAVERAVGQIGRSSQAGSLRFSYGLEIPGLLFSASDPLHRGPSVTPHYHGGKARPGVCLTLRFRPSEDRPALHDVRPVHHVDPISIDDRPSDAPFTRRTAHTV